MALPDLTGQNIEDTYQRLVHTDGADNYFTGDGTSINLGATDISALNIFTGSAETSLTALNSWTGSYTFLSSSQQIADDISGSWQSQNFISGSQVSENLPSGIYSSSLQELGNITSSGVISASGAITSSGLLLPQLGTIEWISNTQERQTIRGTDNYIQIDGDNRVLINADTDVTVTTPKVDLTDSLNVANYITASIVSASGEFIGNVTGNATTATTASYVQTAVTASVAEKARVQSTDQSTNYRVLFSGTSGIYNTIMRDSDNGLTFNPNTDKLTVAGAVSVGDALSVGGDFSLDGLGNTVFKGGLFNHTVLAKAGYAGESFEFGQHSSGDNDNIVQGYVYAYYNGLWYEYNPTGSADIRRRTGILGVATSARVARFMIRGQMRTSAQNLSSMTSGEVLYGSQTTAGRVTNVAISGSGDTVRPIGYVLTPSTGEFWFDPDKTWVET